LGQMLSNLIENALRHTPAGSEITVSLAKREQALVLEVSDTGAGIPVDERDKVMQRLYRLDRSRHTPGHGLGLSLVQAVAALHGAQVTLQDNAPGLRVVTRFKAETE
ncbi:MAG: ATP-binding protein, partial [Sulfitobacter geojensis]